MKVERILKIGPEAVRIAQNPITSEIWHISFNGDVYCIKDILHEEPLVERVFSAEDHGITRLQGMVFLGNTLFLCGNLTNNSGLNNIGRMVRYDLNDADPKPTIVFNTVEYGTNKTAFDHGWNALVISPDQKYIYVNSGSRTDHGEVQDNDGAWPNARDGALTAKIFRFPIDSANLLLVNNEAELKSKGYIFAEGIRNAFGLAFDCNENLFAAVNSGDYDHPEDMFWVREGHHYGFPWIMGGIENPQQYNDWYPDPNKDPFLNRSAFALMQGYFHNDPDFPKKPEGVVFTKGIKNLGPDANEYRDRITGEIINGDNIQEAITTFTAHSSPVGLAFDLKKTLPEEYRGDGFLLRYTSASMPLSLLGLFTDQGSDLLHLKLIYDEDSDDYMVETNILVSGFEEPTDCMIVEDKVYVIEYNKFAKGNLYIFSFEDEEN